MFPTAPGLTGPFPLRTRCPKAGPDRAPPLRSRAATCGPGPSPARRARAQARADPPRPAARPSSPGRRRLPGRSRNTDLTHPPPPSPGPRPQRPPLRPGPFPTRPSLAGEWRPPARNFPRARPECASAIPAPRGTLAALPAPRGSPGSPRALPRGPRWYLRSGPPLAAAPARLSPARCSAPPAPLPAPHAVCTRPLGAPRPAALRTARRRAASQWAHSATPAGQWQPRGGRGAAPARGPGAAMAADPARA
ncbi:uncharacterized protein [Pithys albifrons albifrons]|uniref:uncharacterized protein n=1 Tax=Pithys albifrons albifrons TaxID=3385563 RepID=UPI003A5D0F6E